MIVVFNAFGRWWRLRARKHDLKILWPAILEESHDREQARDAFAAHAMNDPMWSDVSEDEIRELVETL